jgi:toxin HigB-1
VIRRFRHRGLQRLYEHDDRRGVAPEHAEKIRRILARLDEAGGPQDMALPGYRLHPLRGRLAGHWAVDVSGNWRITFRFEGPDVYDVDYTDYH